jgi:predicted O-methyltransferase YrrM
MLNKNIEKYIEDHTSPQHELLQQLMRDTHLKTIYPRMLSGNLLGRFLTMLSRMISPERILEIGTFTGYSAICLALGMNPTGKLYTIEINRELEAISKKYFKLFELEEKIIQIFGDAREIIPDLEEAFDLVFIDADKETYPEYYQLVFDKIRPGGWILADNVLWSGKIIDIDQKQDKETAGIMEFNEFVQRDRRVENVLVPIRDGVMLIRKL